MQSKWNIRPSSSRMERASGRRFFVYAPPLKGARQSKRKPPKPPFNGAKPWQSSVYYFWWKYLRENIGYMQCCMTGGRGKFAKLYRDFGDVRNDDFWTWWKAHQCLFSEPPADHTKVIEDDKLPNRDDYVLVAIPIDIPAALAIQQTKRLLLPLLTRPKRLTTDSKAKYPVATKPVLSSLHTHLQVWDAHKANPNMKYHEIADILGFAVNETLPKEVAADFKRDPTLFRKDIDKEIRRKKTVLVSRHLRIARQYIENVGTGEFPKRDGR
jgi:hypothetical protein